MLEGPKNLGQLLGQFEDTNQANPEDIQLLKKLGRLHLKNGAILNATKIFKQILRIKPEEVSSLIELAICQIKTGLFEEAEFNLERAQELSPKLHTIFLAFSKLYEAKGSAEKQISFLMRAANAAEKRSEIRLNLAELLHRYGDMAGSANQYRLILEKYPDYEAALFGLGTIYMKKNELGKAIKCFSDVVSNNPGAFDAHFNLGNCFFRQKKYAMASRNLRISTRSEAVNEKARYLLAQCHKNLGELDQAIVIIESLVESNGENVFYQNLLAELYMEAGEVDIAKDIYKSLSRSHPERAEFYVKHINALIKMGKIKDAEHVLDKLFRNHPGHIEGHRILGEIYLAKRQYKSAIEEFDRTLMLNENHVAAIKGLADVYFELGDVEKEYEYLERVYQYEETAEIALRLGELESKLRIPTSLNRFKRVKELAPNSNSAREADYYIKHKAA